MDSIINVPLIRERRIDWMKWNYDEPSLLIVDRETYRFSMNCSGSGNYSKIVRVENYKDEYYNAVIKEFEGTTGSPDTKGTVYVFELSQQDWETLKSKLNDHNFWTSIETCNKQLLHGCTWSIDGYNPDKNQCTKKNYHGIGGCYPVDSSFISLYEFFDNLNEQ